MQEFWSKLVCAGLCLSSADLDKHKLNMVMLVDEHTSIQNTTYAGFADDQHFNFRGC